MITLKNNMGIFRKICYYFLIIVMMLSMCLSAYAIEYRGTCGNNVSWTFSESSGELNIYGTGEIDSSIEWFKYKSLIKTVTVSEGVTEICSDAFKFCDNLMTVNLPSTLTQIGAGAFENCKSLQNIVLPKNIVSIGYSAFKNCTQLSKIKISPKVYQLSEKTFMGCHNLSEVIIPISVSEIGDSCFEECISLKSINLTNFVDRIGIRAFAESGLCSFVFPSFEDKIIANSLFMNCRELECVTIPATENLVISADAFTGCDKMSDIYYAGTSEQWKDVVSYDDSITSFNIHYGSIVPEYESLYPSSSEQYNQIDSCSGDFGEALTWSFDAKTGGLKISGEGEMPTYTYYTRAKAPWWFIRNYIKTIQIDDDVTSMGDWTFNECDGLEKIDFGKGIAEIGDNCFYGCDYLTLVVIPGNVKSIGKQSFQSCSHLNNVVLNNGVESLNEYAFSYNVGLTNVTIADSVTYIGEGVFKNDILKCINYEGTEAKWNSITISSENDYLSNASKNYNYKIKDVLDDENINDSNKKENVLNKETQEKFSALYVVIPAIAVIIILCSIFAIKKKRH